jgi:hypothetical protein
MSGRHRGKRNITACGDQLVIHNRHFQTEDAAQRMMLKQLIAWIRLDSCELHCAVVSLGLILWSTYIPIVFKHVPETFTDSMEFRNLLT